MHTDYLKIALMAAWIAAVAAVGYLSGTSSFVAWTGLAVMSLTLPLIMLHFWGTPAPTMTESIRDVLRNPR